MKKVYSIPTIEIEDMETQEMLAASPTTSPDVTINKNGSVEAGNVEGRFGLFDEDEE